MRGKNASLPKYRDLNALNKIQGVLFSAFRYTESDRGHFTIKKHNIHPKDVTIYVCG